VKLNTALLALEKWHVKIFVVLRIIRLPNGSTALVFSRWERKPATTSPVKIFTPKKNEVAGTAGGRIENQPASSFAAGFSR
jgi:hypothetical protein